MSNEEDSEVILEEGELHKYLQLQGSDSDLCDLYSNGKSLNGIFGNEEILPLVQSKLVSREVINHISVILNSTLLLDEDAIYLYKKFSELIPESQYKTTYKVWLPAVILAISTCGSLFYCLKNVCVALVCCSSLTLLWGMKRFYAYFNNTRSINKLVCTLKEITSYIRKNIKLLQEEDAVLNSKQKLHLLRNGEDIINTFAMKRKRVEIFIVLQKLVLTLQSLIVVSRRMTLSILHIANKNLYLTNNTHLASYSDEQLGINKKCEDFDEEMNLFPYLDVLKNIHVIMQSETLRELGLLMSDCPESPMLFELIHQYNFESSVILRELIKQYQKYFNPIYVQKTKITPKNNTKYLYTTVNGISLSLNSLLNDSRKLQEFVEENSNETIININKSVGKKLLDMGKEITDLKEHINNFSQLLLKENNCTQDSPNLVHLPVKKSTKAENAIDISKSSAPTFDEVYLDYIEGDVNYLNVDDYAEEYIKPKHHYTLMNELKGLLVSKRKEFEEREIKALKSEEEIESYKACSAECNIINQNKNKNELKSSNMVHINEMVPGSNPFIQSVGGTFSKDVATEAINLFRTWNRKSDEKCFGDESDDSSEIFSSENDEAE